MSSAMYVNSLQFGGQSPGSEKHRSAFDTWIAFTLFVLPVTSFLAVPQIQGTTPANLMLIGLFVPIPGLFLLCDDYSKIIRKIVLFVFISTILFVVSRYSLLTEFRSVGSLSLINPRFVLPLTMAANVTQYLYLIVAVFLFLLVRERYSVQWDRALFAGAWFLVAYALADWAAAAFLKSNVDFLANRVFEAGRFEHPGSLRQGISIVGFQIMRLKGFTGEPSMYAITALPYLVLALSRGRKPLSIALVVTLVLTFSSTAALGLVMVLAYFVKRISFGYVVSTVILGGAAFVILIWVAGAEFAHTIDSLFISKLTGEAHSGIARAASFSRHFSVWAESGLFPFLFGFGFGTARSTDLLSSLLVNVGLLGTVTVIGFMWVSIRRAKMGGLYFEAWGVFVIFGLMLISVPEFAYLPPWLLLGIATRGKVAEE